MSNGTSCGWVKVASLPSEAVPDVGNVSADTTTPPTAGQLAQWTDPTTIKGIDFPTGGMLSVTPDGKLLAGPNWNTGAASGPAGQIVNAANTTFQWKVALGGLTITPRASGIMLGFLNGYVQHSAVGTGIAVAFGYGPMPYPQTGSIITGGAWPAWNVTGAWDPMNISTANYAYQYSNHTLMGFQDHIGEAIGIVPVMGCGNAGTATLQIVYITVIEF
jgi:hypothetical protein